MLKRWLNGLQRTKRGARGRSVARDGGGAVLALAGLGGAGLATTSRETLPLVDRALIGVVALLIMVGTVMVYSASISLADSPRFNVAPTHFLVRHLFSLVDRTLRRGRGVPGSDGDLAATGTVALRGLVRACWCWC